MFQIPTGARGVSDHQQQHKGGGADQRTTTGGTAVTEFRTRPSAQHRHGGQDAEGERASSGGLQGAIPSPGRGNNDARTTPHPKHKIRTSNALSLAIAA